MTEEEKLREEIHKKSRKEIESEIFHLWKEQGELHDDIEALETKLEIAVKAIRHNHWWITGDALRFNCDGCVALRNIRGEK